MLHIAVAAGRLSHACLGICHLGPLLDGQITPWQKSEMRQYQRNTSKSASHLATQADAPRPPIQRQPLANSRSEIA